MLAWKTHFTTMATENTEIKAKEYLPEEANESKITKEYLVEEANESQITSFLRAHSGSTTQDFSPWLRMIHHAVYEVSPDCKRIREYESLPFETVNEIEPEMKMTREAIDALILGAENVMQDIFEGALQFTTPEDDPEEDPEVDSIAVR